MTTNRDTILLINNMIYFFIIQTVDVCIFEYLLIIIEEN